MKAEKYGQSFALPWKFPGIRGTSRHMGQVIPRFLAVLAVSGLVASILAYIGTYRGITRDSLVPWVFVALHVGIFILFAPMVAIEYSAFMGKTPAWVWFSRGRPIERGSFSWKGYAQGVPLWDESFFFKGFSQGMPRWVVPAIKFSALFFAFHLILFLILCSGAKTEIRNHEYVLSRGDKIVKILTQPEYFRLQAAELRVFATGWISFYLLTTMYWWFPKSQASVPD